MTNTTPWGPVGYLTYKRTYAREKDDGTTEDFKDSIERQIIAFRDQLNCGFTSEEEDKLRYYFSQLKSSVAGRFWWQLGTKTVDKLGLMSLQNCAGCVVDGPVTPFVWAFDALMLGSGVGYNIQREYVYELPRIKGATITREDSKDADFIVPDSREGWCELLKKTLEALFLTGKGFSYSTVCIRSKGARIKSFGGVASGPEELCWGMAEISKLLNARVGKKARPIDCLDIMNIIGYIVVSGNVRRSAQIAMGDADDLQYLNAKRWDLGSIPNWRAMSNNSVICNDFSVLPDQFWEGYKGNGEPYGLINLKLSRTTGRASDSQYSDPDVVVYNPCAEQSLNNYETCCLAEQFLPNHESYSSFMESLKLLYRINKHSLALACHWSTTNAIVHKNMRMGIGVTGIAQAAETQKRWLSPAYNELRAYDKEYSKKMGWPTSIKLTTVKPSGTLSLLAGVTPGCHPGYAQYFIRRIRIAAGSPLIDKCKASGYHVEPVRNYDGSADTNTVVVEFPCSYPEGTVLAAETSAVQQLETVKWLQTDWSDNAVSCTIYYKKEELEDIKEWLSLNYNTNVKTCSFLLHTDHGFDQAPYEEITKERYEELVKSTTPITAAEATDIALEDLNDCKGGSCPVR